MESFQALHKILFVLAAAAAVTAVAKERGSRTESESFC